MSPAVVRRTWPLTSAGVADRGEGMFCQFPSFVSASVICASIPWRQDCREASQWQVCRFPFFSNAVLAGASS